MSRAVLLLSDVFHSNARGSQVVPRAPQPGFQMQIAIMNELPSVVLEKLRDMDLVVFTTTITDDCKEADVQSSRRRYYACL